MACRSSPAGPGPIAALNAEVKADDCAQGVDLTWFRLGRPVVGTLTLPLTLPLTGL